MRFRRFGLIAVLALGGLFAAACGDDDDGGSGGGGGGGGGGDSAFCDQARALEEAEEFDPSNEEAFEDAIDQARDALESAPDEIQDDVQVLLDALEAFESGDFESIDTDELEQAGQNLDEYLRDQCGIDVEST